jgi:predicted GH43/DUF377 family glycosyl hydrolase
MNRKLGTLLALLVVTALIYYSQPSLGSNGGIQWTKYSGNPLTLEIARAYEPWVLYQGGEFRMWYTGQTDTCRIYYATSSNGIDWAPHGMVLDKGGFAWEQDGVRQAIVLFNGTHYNMWYTGYHFGYIGNIGYATSSDGVNWIKYGNPVLVPGSEWDSNIGPHAIVFNGTSYIMWYTGNAARNIGVATSLNGIDWTKYLGNPVMNTGPSSWDSDHIYSGPVLWNGRAYVMWYSGQKGIEVRVGLATSPDGYSWSKWPENPVIDLGPPGAWDSANVCAGSVVPNGNCLVMWYWGQSNPSVGNPRMGLAESYIPCIPVEICFEPSSLNVRSKGKWITAYIELPEGYDVDDINVSSLLLNETISVDPCAPTAIGDYDSDGVPDLLVKFDRAKVQSYIVAHIDLTELARGRFMDVTLTITGKLDDGTPFQGSDTIRVMLPPKAFGKFPETIEALPE